MADRNRTSARRVPIHPVLTENQINREAARKRIALYKAAHWRARADQLREKAKRVRAVDSECSPALLRIAADFDFLAAYEERKLRPCL